jgi:hypothetical protein
MAMEWYYSEKGRRQGPISEEALRKKIDRGELAAGELVWSQGMTNWQPITQTPPFNGQPLKPADDPGAAREVETEVVSTPSGASPYAPPESPFPGPPGQPGQAPREAGKATTSMVLGICGVVLSCIPCIGLILGILAVVFSGQVLTAAQANADLAPFVGNAKIGRVTGIAAIVLSVVVWILGILFNLGGVEVQN